MRVDAGASVEMEEKGCRRRGHALLMGSASACCDPAAPSRSVRRRCFGGRKRAGEPASEQQQLGAAQPTPALADLGGRDALARQVDLAHHNTPRPSL